ncbi:hypothetical protein [Rickettsia australis]|uniref:Uncharacterized protein n=1 Tax=Rickettsia australis (strain Cutlack) TaxID=1105110 RepID=H8K8E0_RICAC|nr:hypothetical protein [Rickettsia australis]AFC71533.1 hypothetical protein MC5_06465 [Rickettsia australis str. Cutlack]
MSIRIRHYFALPCCCVKFCVLESIVTAALPILTKLAISGASFATAKTGVGNKLVSIARLITFPSSLLLGITPTIFLCCLQFP